MSAELNAFLSDLHLGDAFDTLVDCGIERVQDLGELDLDDLIGLGVEDEAATSICGH